MGSRTEEFRSASRLDPAGPEGEDLAHIHDESGLDLDSDPWRIICGSGLGLD